MEDVETVLRHVSYTTQLMPADDWDAVIVLEDGRIEPWPLMFWALTRHESSDGPWTSIDGIVMYEGSPTDVRSVLLYEGDLTIGQHLGYVRRHAFVENEWRGSADLHLAPLRKARTLKPPR